MLKAWKAWLSLKFFPWAALKLSGNDCSFTTAADATAAKTSWRLDLVEIDPKVLSWKRLRDVEGTNLNSGPEIDIITLLEWLIFYPVLGNMSSVSKIQTSVVIHILTISFNSHTGTGPLYKCCITNLNLPVAIDPKIKIRIFQPEPDLWREDAFLGRKKNHSDGGWQSPNKLNVLEKSRNHRSPPISGILLLQATFFGLLRFTPHGQRHHEICMCQLLNWTWERTAHRLIISSWRKRLRFAGAAGTAAVA